MTKYETENVCKPENKNRRKLKFCGQVRVKLNSYLESEFFVKSNGESSTTLVFKVS